MKASKLCRYATVALCLNFISVGIHAEPKVLDKIVAVVDQGVITQSQLDAKMAQVVDNSAGKQLPPQDILRKQVLERLVVDELQRQMADRAGVRISDEMLNDTLVRIAGNNGMTLQEFRAQLEADGRSYKALREQIRSEMTLNQVQRGNLRSRIVITEQEVENYLDSSEGRDLTASRYHIAHIVLPKASINDKNKIAFQALAHQINEKQASFNTVLQAQTFNNGIKLDGGDLGWRLEAELPSIFTTVVPQLLTGEVSNPIASGAGLHIVSLLEKRGGTNQLIKQTHARHILIKPSAVRDETQAKALADEIYQRVQKGEDFGDLAKQYSDDTGSALQGGDLDWASPGQMVPAFEKAMDSTAINAISAPVQSQFGWHIIQVLDRREHDISAERFKEQAYQAVYQRKFDDELAAWLQEIRDEAFVEYK